jgi:ABC-2 type transport system permease protein
MRDLRMWLFHTSQFARNGYFAQLLVTSTLSMVALQALAARTPGARDVDLGWLRAGIVGTWTVCTVAAGMIGYQRFQGTLVHLVRTPLTVWRTLLPVVGAASVFGLAALPLAAVVSLLLGQPVSTSGLPSMLGATLLLWLACLAVSAVVAMVFVLTPNAMTYEALLAVPLVLASGVFGTPGALPGWAVALTHILPTRGAVDTLLTLASAGSASPVTIVGALIAAVGWLVVAHLCAQVVVRRATSAGTLEVV